MLEELNLNIATPKENTSDFAGLKSMLPYLQFNISGAKWKLDSFFILKSCFYLITSSNPKPESLKILSSNKSIFEGLKFRW